MADEHGEKALTAVRRRVRLWQIVFFVVLFGAFDTVGIFTTLANRANFGQVLSLWEPAVWQYSSFVLMLALIPFIAWFNDRVPNRRADMEVVRAFASAGDGTLFAPACERNGELARTDL